MEKLYFRNSKVLKLCGILDRPEGSNVLVILCHGYMSKKGKYAGSVTSVSEKLNKVGISTFRFDFSGHLESEGDDGNVNVATGIDDLNSAVNFMKKYEWKKIGLFGSSFGGIACLFVGKRNDVDCLVLRSGAYDYVEIRNKHFGEEGIKKWEEQGYITYDEGYLKPVKVKYSFYEAALKHKSYEEAKIIKVPTLVIHGELDENIPVDQSLKVFENLNCEKKLEIIKDGDHGLYNPERLEKVAVMSVDWLKRWLL